MARDPWLDNVKMLLVTVVVIGHSLLLAPDHDFPGFRTQLYTFVYFWHIPAFVLVTGYFSRSFHWTRRHLTALFVTIGVPFLLFEPLMLAFRRIVGGEVIDAPMWINPHWPMWYLIAVLIWRLATPVLRSHWVMIPLSIAVSVAIGAVGCWVFDLNRVLGLLPFFVLGLHAKPAHLALLRSTTARVLAVPVLVVLWHLAGTVREWLHTAHWLWYSWTYDRIGVDLATGIDFRLRVLAIGLIGTLAVVAVVPRRGGWFAAMGQWTLVVYLFHGFVVKGVEYAGYSDWTHRHEDWTLIPTVAGAVALALLLAWDPVARRLNVIVDPVGSLQRYRAARRQGA